MNAPEQASELGISQQNVKRVSYTTVLTLAYQSLGVVYGDISTSPLYVYKTAFSGKLSLHENDEEIFGVLSFIFWTMTLIALFKYIFIVMSANDNGEGGTFALYSLLCRHARLSILPNQQDVDEKLSSYARDRSADSQQSLALKSFLEKHPIFRTSLLIFVLLGTCMAIGDGILTPSISVLSAVSGVKLKIPELHESTEGWVSLGGVVLSITGVEAMFTDMGHFSPLSIRVAFTVLVYPSLILAYMGEAAFLSKHHEDIQRSFYKAIPEPVFWPVFIVATLAAVVGSQAVISATFSIVSQSSALNCFPRVKIIHTSSKIYGQIYIPEVNWMLMFLCLAVTIGLRDTNMIGHAYGLAVTTVMFVTTCLMGLIIIIVWKRRIINAISFVVICGSVELLYISSSICKVPEGGWIPLTLSLIFMAVMYIWNYGTMKKHQFDIENKVSINRIISLGPSLGMVRVPGIGLVYTNLVTGIPAIFGHFVTNLLAFHQVLVFVCVKSVQVPHVSEHERFLMSRVGPKEYGMFRCIVRYGYKDLQQENYNFDDSLVTGILQFVETEDGDCSRPAAISSGQIGNQRIQAFSTRDLSSLGLYHETSTQSQCDVGGTSSDINQSEAPPLKGETLRILKAEESGVAHILGHSYAKAKKSSPILKKLAIDVVYAFLNKNCRDPDDVLNVPHTSLLEVGMVYYV
ncbi:potassium transporter 1 isoform X3 [Rhodamnia argentea]|uniref:Potassium transporter n=1 Tax=Rhodamnia argentea TaxID=178133 RepID=A0A8B8PTP3_9MYRT|nr:potassium transporter 1 isoform X3 [Rhodamnia argentea]